MKLSLAWQASLFACDPPAVDATFGGLVRYRLDDASWVDHAPGWLAGSDDVFQQLVDTASWRQREVHVYERTLLEPRLTAGWEAGDAGLPPVLREVSGALSERYGVAFEHIWVNLYRDGTDSVAWHGDRNRHHARNPLVATVSLGEPRTFQLRRRGTSKILHRFRLGGGDLLVMGGACQHDWEHAVPKVAKAGPRMSVTLRHTRVY